VVARSGKGWTRGRLFEDLNKLGTKRLKGGELAREKVTERAIQGHFSCQERPRARGSFSERGAGEVPCKKAGEALATRGKGAARAKDGT